MTPVARGLLLGLVQVGIVGLLGAKFLFDRNTLPRVWVATVPVDPDLPIRGRYVELRAIVPVLEIPEELAEQETAGLALPVRLRVEGSRLVAEMVEDGGPSSGTVSFQSRGWDGEETSLPVLDPPLAYFIPEHVADPSIREAGEELWVEVTVPERGAPRPIRLGVKRPDAPVAPL